MFQNGHPQNQIGKRKHDQKECISEDLARCAGTSVLDICHNRQADFVARDVCKFVAPVDPIWLTKLPKLIYDHHCWLVKVAREIGQDNEADKCKKFEPREQLEPEIDDTFIENSFKVWSWPPHAPKNAWKFKAKIPCAPPAKWKEGDNNWNTFCRFLSGLHWRLDKDSCWSYLELAVIFVLRGFQLQPCDPEIHTLADLTPRIKKAVTCILKSNYQGLLPGNHNPDYNKPTGKTLPSGVLEGVDLCCDRHELLSLGKLILGGGNHRLSSWSTCLCDLN